MSRSDRVVVVGVGNLLLKDEGIGVHVAHALQDMNLPGIEVIDGGTSPDVLVSLEPAEKLIIVDAAQAGGEPGAIYRLHPGDLADEPGEAVSLHELGVRQNLRMMRLVGNEPREVVIIGIQPKEIDWGMELTPELQQKVPEIIELVLREIDQ